MFVGLMGDNLWEETLNDVVIETFHDVFNNLGPKAVKWKVLKLEPEPENIEEIWEDVKSCLLRAIAYIKSVSEKRGKQFLISDKVRLI